MTKPVRIPYDELDFKIHGLNVEVHQTFQETGAKVVFTPRLPGVAVRPGQILVIEARDGPHDAYNVVTDEKPFAGGDVPDQISAEGARLAEARGKRAEGFPKRLNQVMWELSDGQQVRGAAQAEADQRKLDMHGQRRREASGDSDA